MDIKTITEVELKALAFDQVKLLQQTQQNINLIEQELLRRKETKEGENG
jgi:hypothetical protein